MFRSHPFVAPTRVVVTALTIAWALLLAFSPLSVMAATPSPSTTQAKGGHGSATAAPEPQANPQLLGEYAFVDMKQGDTYNATVVIPETGSYLITAVDDKAAADFNMTVTDEAGKELYHDVFKTTELPLDTGTISLTFSAANANTLSFVVLGQIGGMTTDEKDPGKLVPGSIYDNQRVNDTLYATLSIPPTVYPRQVLIALQPGDGDEFNAYAQGDNVSATIDTKDDTILRFWTHGGDFTVQVQPDQRRSKLSLAVFVTGEPTTLTFDKPLDGIIPSGATESVYQVQVDTNYTDLKLSVDSKASLGVTLLDNYYNYKVYYSSNGEPSVDIDALYPGVYYVVVQATDKVKEDTPFTLNITGKAGRPTMALEQGKSADDEFAEGEKSLNYSFNVDKPGARVAINLKGGSQDVDFDLNAGLKPGATTWSSYSSGSDETLSFLAPVAGTYYISVLSNDNTGKFSVEAEQGDVAPTLATNELLYDNIKGHAQNFYLLPVTEAGQLLSVIMVGPEATDLDLTVNGYDNSGENILSLSGYSSGSAEAVSYLLPAAGVYEVGVSSNYSDDGGDFFIEAQLVDPNYFGAQWATGAKASSEYGNDQYSAKQATGASDTPTAGDTPTAWASAQADDGVQTLALTYDVAVKPSAILIYESYNPGAITTIEAYNSKTKKWVAIYKGKAGPTDEAYRVFQPELTPVDFETNQIRLTLDTAAVDGFNEIDAVKLYGRP